MVGVTGGRRDDEGDVVGGLAARAVVGASARWAAV
jgi:hypothetical protein